MLKLESTGSTPEIEITQSSFRMTGVCTPENPPKFFDTFMEEFDNLIEEGNCELTFHLDYFNTGSSKCLLNLFKNVKQNAGRSIRVTWIYEPGDAEMKESGELYSEIAEMDFNFVESRD
jgi:hypothetical protein